MKKLRIIRPESLPIIGGAFACAFWLIDTLVDTYIFNKHRLFIEGLLAPDALELWSRSQVVFLLMLFALLSMVLLKRQIRITNQLSHYKRQLERIVDDRTHDLQEKNSQLEVEVEERRKAQKELAYLATIDPLTGISNRRKFDEVLSYELMRDERYNNGLSLILCDLDHFKKVNDKFGHTIGDEVLKEFSHLLSKHIRTSDILARWGGEEFVLLLPETNMSVAIQIAHKLRGDIEQHNFSTIGNLTASFGVTQYLRGDNESSFIHRADQALYRSKESGRNLVDVLPPLQVLLRMYSKQDQDSAKSQLLKQKKPHRLISQA